MTSALLSLCESKRCLPVKTIIIEMTDKSGLGGGVKGEKMSLMAKMSDIKG